MTQDEIYQIALSIFPISNKEKNETFIALLTHFAMLVAAEAIADYEKQEPQGVQVSPKQFVESTFGNRHLVGRPVIWAEWPSREKNT